MSDDRGDQSDHPVSSTQQSAHGHSPSKRPSRTTASPVLPKRRLPDPIQLLLKSYSHFVGSAMVHRLSPLTNNNNGLYEGFTGWWQWISLRCHSYSIGERAALVPNIATGVMVSSDVAEDKPEYFFPSRAGGS